MRELMRARHLSVPEFHRELATRGHKFDLKTLYRLASTKPMLTINTPVLRAVCETLNVDIGKIIVWQPPAPRLHRIDSKTQGRLNDLMSRSNEGTLTGEERVEFEELAARVEQLSLENAKLMARSAKSAKGMPKASSAHAPQD